MLIAIDYIALDADIDPAITPSAITDEDVHAWFAGVLLLDERLGHRLNSPSLT
jgi:hypothetical protein